MKVSREVRSTHSGDGAIVLHIGKGQMYRLNPVGSRILELLKQGQSEEEITEQVSQQFDVAREVVAGDLREFLAVLEKHHLVESRPSPSSR